MKTQEFSVPAFVAKVTLIVLFLSVATIPITAQGSGSTSRVSVASDGTQGNNDSYSPAISADGRYVAFRSSANNLISGDTNSASDIFVYDRQTSTTERVSVASNGTQGNDNSDSPAISADGRYVTFFSFASNLVSGDTNDNCGESNCSDIFVHDRQTNTTSRLSIASDGTQGNNSSYYPAISADGRYISFGSICVSRSYRHRHEAKAVVLREQSPLGLKVGYFRAF